MSGTTTAGTPAYVRWAESVHQLLDDRDGVELFEKYLKQQGLDHLLLFYLACKGFKNTVQQNADSQDNSGDEEGHRAQAKAQELLMAGKGLDKTSMSMGMHKNVIHHNRSFKKHPFFIHFSMATLKFRKC